MTAARKQVSILTLIATVTWLSSSQLCIVSCALLREQIALAEPSDGAIGLSCHRDNGDDEAVMSECAERVESGASRHEEQPPLEVNDASSRAAIVTWHERQSKPDEPNHDPLRCPRHHDETAISAQPTPGHELPTLATPALFGPIGPACPNDPGGSPISGLARRGLRGPPQSVLRV